MARQLRPVSSDGQVDPGDGSRRLIADERLLAYRVGLRARAAVTQCLTEMRKGAVRFWIGGPGEEVHGAATALAIHHFDQAAGAAEGWHTALFPHYRSDALVTLLAELRGHADFTLDYFRQALGKATDAMTSGRQMVMHVSLPERGIMPVQSPLGMNLGKAAGWARGEVALGRTRPTVAVCGDGTTSTSDFHECFVASGLWRLPLVVIVTDNEIAISVTRDEGRGIRDFGAYARAFGGSYLRTDGTRLDTVYASTTEALQLALTTRAPVILHVDVPRLRGHSSSDGASFCYDVPDPLLQLGQELVDEGLLPETDTLRRRPDCAQRDYMSDHIPGRLMEIEIQRIRDTLEQVRLEPAPEPGSEVDFATPPFPEVVEPENDGTTTVQINEALNLALTRMCDEGNTLVWGQDVAGEKGGVFKVTRRLSERFPAWVQNAPINEPLIVGTAVGAAHHAQLRAVPEIQFGDYSLNTLHWLVHAGNTYWGSGGRIPLNVTLRTPVDPVPGGALYHSMSVDGYFTPVQGWVICCASTTFDAYGLLRTAADYAGPVLMLEPKILYRRAVGPRLPGEPSLDVIKAARRSRGEPLLDADDLACIQDFRVPFGRAAVRRTGEDVTLVSYGNAALQSLEAAEALAEEGLSVEVIDLRTLSPWDHETVLRSARRTGRLLVVHQDRSFAGFGREVQGTAHEAIHGLTSRVLGMRNVPAVGQAKELEEHTVLNASRIADAVRDVVRRSEGAFQDSDVGGLQWAPSRRVL